MKRTLLLLGAFLLSMNVVFSQAAFWSEDFASGIPAGWTNTGTDAGGQSYTNLWKYTTTGNHSALGYPTTTLHSPSAANGWVIFDSDSLDNAGVQGPQTGNLTTSSISCVGHPRVLLQFWQLYFNGFGGTRVIVSNGSTSDTIEANADYEYIFNSTPNPSFRQFDISDIAGNQANVKVTFQWNDGIYFYWQVDDVALIDAPANDLGISRAGSFDYYQYPQSQLDTMFWYARVTNHGTADQTNTKAAIAISRGSSVVFTDTTLSGVTLTPGVDSALIGPNLWTPTNPAIGTYTSIISTFADSADAILFDNADTSKFAVTDSVMALDNGLYGGSFALYDPTSSSPSNEWANVFYISQPDTLTSILAGFDQLFSKYSATTGAVVQAKIYSLDNNFNATPLFTTESKMLTSSTFGPRTVPNIVPKMVTLKVDITTGTPILQPGYYAVSIYSTSNDSTIYLASATKKPFGAYSGEFQNGQPVAFYSNTQFFLRMAFGHNLNLLYCNWTRNPSTTPLYTGRPVTFTGSSNGSANAQYNWTLNGLQSGWYQTYNSRVFRDTFTVADDSINVCLTVTDGGNTAQSCKIVRVRVDPLGGVNDIQGVSAFNMVPNPTTGAVTISAEGVSGATTITLTNMLGEVVKHYNETANGTFSKPYNVSDLSSGVYIVKIQNGDNSSTKRLSISK
ncbi:MAG: T9SS type A sorting domain-containing protein [Bacteroidetes bacterium]|nr:T9SS type A sorting domain-containing protein [Bacteroidota bacterium]